MKEDIVLYSSKNRIAKIILNRPQALNAVSRELFQQLGNAMDRARMDESVNIAILTGKGAAFCAGADVGSLDEMTRASSMEVYHYITEFNEAVKKVIQFPKPLLTAVNGAALGAGSCFALAGDVVVASQTAIFGFLFSRFNLIADVGSSFILPRLVGSLRARDLIFSGRTFSAKEAMEYGVVSQVVDPEDFEAAVAVRAQEMAKWPTEAVAMNKWLLVKAESGCDLETLLELEARTQIALLSSPETQHRIKAFLERKKPKGGSSTG